MSKRMRGFSGCPAAEPSPGRPKGGFQSEAFAFFTQEPDLLVEA